MFFSRKKKDHSVSNNNREPVAPQPSGRRVPKPRESVTQFFTVFTNLKDAYGDFSPEIDEVLEHIRADFHDRWSEMKTWPSFDGKEDAINQWRETDACYECLFADSNIFSILERNYREAFPIPEELAVERPPILVEA